MQFLQVGMRLVYVAAMKMERPFVEYPAGLATGADIDGA